MRVPKQIINLAGTLVVLVAIAVGVVTVATPLYLQAMSTGAQVASIAGDNDGISAEVRALQAEEAQLDTTRGAVAALTAQLPATGRVDDAFELIAAAAARSGVTVRSAQADDAVAWTARTQPTPEGTAAAAGTGDDTSGTSDAGAGQDATAGGTAGSTSLGPDRQVPLTIVADAPSPAAAAAFVDALGRGPRLIGIVHVSLSPQGDASQLTVNALAFIHTES